VISHWGGAAVVKIFKFRAQSLLLSFSLCLCGSAGLPSRTLEAGDLAGELDAVEALREVLRVHPEEHLTGEKTITASLMLGAKAFNVEIVGH